MSHALTIAQSSIRQDAHGRYCLNDLHKVAGNEKRPDGQSKFPRLWPP